MVVVDRLSKYAHFGTLPSGFDALLAAKLFIEIVAKHHGFPKFLLSDRDPVFMSTFWIDLMKLSGTTLQHTTAYHPQTDGQTEVMNRSLEQYLRAFTFDRPTRWADLLPWAELVLNCSVHEGLRVSPFQALYGRPSPSLFPTISTKAKSEEVTTTLLERAEVLQGLKANLVKMQTRMSIQANKYRRNVEFKEGDLVLLKLQPYRQHSMARPVSAKLSRRFYGPFKVCKKIGKVAYQLELPADAKIHNIFHVSLLRPFVSNGSNTPPISTEVLNGRPVSVPVAATAERTVMVNDKPQVQWHVRWSDSLTDNSTWEPMEHIRLCFPNLRLEVKDVSNRGGVDTDTVVSNEDIGQSSPTPLTSPQLKLPATNVRRSQRRRTANPKYGK